jgi:hypothetical protein
MANSGDPSPAASSPAPPGLLCSIFVFVGTWVLKTEDSSVMLKSSTGLLAKCFFTLCCVSAASCKINIKSQKNPKIANPILLGYIFYKACIYF